MDRTSKRFDATEVGFSARARLALRRFRLRNAAQWGPLKDPRRGYTIIIPLPWQCWDLALIPLLAIQRVRRIHCAEVIITVNATEQAMLLRHGQLSIASMIKAFAPLRPRIVYFSARQERAAIKSPNDDVGRWLSLANGLAQTGTRHALLHDPETVVLDSDFAEKHFEVASGGNNTFTGIMRDRRYCNEHGADLLTPLQLMIDVAAVRSLFTPIDLYRAVRPHNGGRVACDLLCDIQWRLPDASRVLHEVPDHQIVGLAPLLSEWSAMKYTSTTFAPQRYSPLPVVPYFRWLKRDPDGMLHASEALERHDRAVTIDGCTVDLSGLDQGGRDRIAHQIEALDRYFSGVQSPAIRRYAQALADHQQPIIDPPIPEIVISRVDQALPAPNAPVKP